MRDLTAEELALAPEWATHYIVDSDDSIIYENTSFCWWCGLNDPIDNTVCFGKMKNRPITGRELDITQHEWSDVAVVDCEQSCGALLVYISNSEQVTFNKTDAIAIAKHFKLISEDLK